MSQLEWGWRKLGKGDKILGGGAGKLGGGESLWLGVTNIKTRPHRGVGVVGGEGWGVNIERCLTWDGGQGENERCKMGRV